MGKEFHVSEREIPDSVTIHLSLEEKAVFARMLTSFGIPVSVAGDTFEHLYKKGLLEMYNREYKHCDEPHEPQT